MEIQGIATELQIGKYSVNRVPEIEIISDRYAPVSLCSFVLPDPHGELFKAFSPNDAVSLRYGYRGAALAEWSGAIRYINRREQNLHIICRDSGADILDTHITGFWASDSAAAIVKYALSLIGSIGTIQDDAVVFPHFVVSDVSVYEVLRNVQATLFGAFGIDMSKRAVWRDTSGAWQWGDHFETLSSIPKISSEAGLIAHRNGTEGYSGRSIVETWPLAGFRHSQPFRLKDSYAGIDSVFHADVVRHVFKGRTVRTYIEYKEA